MAAETEFAGSAQLLVQSWAVGSEKRQQVITAMLETRQGYLWIGTNKGLVRFDGVRFTDFPYTTTAGMSQGGTNFAAIWEDSFGGIWAGTEAGVTHYDGARFVSLTTRDGLPSNSVVRVDGDPSGAVWLFTPKLKASAGGIMRNLHSFTLSGTTEPPANWWPVMPISPAKWLISGCGDCARTTCCNGSPMGIGATFRFPQATS